MDDFLSEQLVKASDQSSFLNIKDFVPIDCLLHDRHRKFQPPVEQNLEQQVLTSSIILDAGFEFGKSELVSRVWLSDDVGHVGGVHME